MRRIAILMTCYNRVETTLECLRLLMKQVYSSDCNFDVWLVDDASPDKTGEKVKSEFPQIHIVQGTGKLFWCKGMRLAWDSAADAFDYDYYLWFNDDARLDADALMTAVRDSETLGADGDGVIVGVFRKGEKDMELSYGGDDRIGNKIIPNGKTPIRIDGLFAGNFVLVPRRVYKMIGPICGKYSHAFGDCDYALTLRERGIPAYVTSKVIGWCKGNLGAFDALKRPLLKRLKLLMAPGIFNLPDNFLFKIRHYGVLRAFLSVGHVTWIVVKGT